MPSETLDTVAIAEEVSRRLQHKPGDSPIDLYVWADGRITGPPAGDDPKDEQAVAVFSPNDSSLAVVEIESSIRRGLTVVDDQEPDTPAVQR